MTVRLLLLAALALVTTGCLHRPAPHLTYLCRATLSNEDGEFYASEDAVGWIYDLGGGMRATLHLPHAWQSREDFRANGWGRALDSPSIVIVFDHRFTRNVWTEPTRLTAFGELRIGAHARRDWVSTTPAVTFPYSEWHGLLDEQGDLEVTLFETPHTVLQRGIIPRSTLERLVPTLQRLADEAIEMERDPRTRCEAYEDEEVVVT